MLRTLAVAACLALVVPVQAQGSFGRGVPVAAQAMTVPASKSPTKKATEYVAAIYADGTVRALTPKGETILDAELVARLPGATPSPSLPWLSAAETSTAHFKLVLRPGMSINDETAPYIAGVNEWLTEALHCWVTAVEEEPQGPISPTSRADIIRSLGEPTEYVTELQLTPKKKMLIKTTCKNLTLARCIQKHLKAVAAMEKALGI